MLRAHAAVERVFQFNLIRSNFKRHSRGNAFCFSFFTTLIFLGCYNAATAQSNIVHQSLYWFRYFNQTELTSKYLLQVEIDERRFYNPDLQSQFFIHAHVHRRLLKNLDGGVGLTYVATNSNRNNHLVVPEWRPFQEVSFTQPLAKKIQTQLRYRIDERYVHNTNAQELMDGYNFILRHRFRLQFTYPIRKLESGKSLILKASDEIMFNSTDNANTFDQNRIYGGVEWQFNEKWSIEMGYMNLYQSAIANEYFDRDIIRCTFYHKLSLVKKN